MQILSRLLIVVVLLGSLAYGSYAFGKYVLSAHLLNDAPIKSGADEAVKRSTRAAEAVTRQTEYKGSQPKVELKVLPAGADGAGPPPPPRKSFVRHAERDRQPTTDALAERAIERELEREQQLLSGADQPARNDQSEMNSLSSRLRTSRNTSDERNETDTKKAKPTESDPLVELGLSSSSRPDVNSPISGGGVYRSGRADGRGSDEERPRRRRRIRKKPTEAPPVQTRATPNTSVVPVPEAEPSRPTRTQRATVITDSPVPRPESSGSESPIPQPE